MSTLTNYIFNGQATAPNAPAIILPPTALVPGSQRELSISYDDLQGLVRSVREQLDATGLLKAQESVSMSLINGIEFAVSFLAVGEGRCIAAPLNPTYTQDEAEFYLSDSKSKLLLIHAGAINATSGPGVGAIQAARKLGTPIAEVIFDSRKGASVRIRMVEGGSKGVKGKSPQGSEKPLGDDCALLLHTSGTTGKPKAVPLTHRNLTTTMRNIVNTYHLTSKDRSFLVMPLFHVHGLLAGLLAPLASGGSAVIPPKFSASTFWKEYTATNSTWYTAVPTMHQILLQSPRPSPLPNIRFIRSCSSALSATTHGALEDAFKAPVLEAYARKPGTVGLGQGVEIRILDFDSDKQVEEGEVCIRGANVTKGYLNNDKANVESFTGEGFFRTGDRGSWMRMACALRLILTGRLKELINRGGEKLSPLELDSALLAVKGVAEAVAFGVPDSKYGEVPWAAVVLETNAKIGEAEIKKHLAKRLGKFKIPERIFVTDAIPKTATGKIQRRKVAEVFLEKAKESPKAKL